MTSTNTTTATETVLDDLPEALRHPHLIDFTLTRTDEYNGSSQWRYRAFTGTEPRPERPDDLWDQDVDYLLRRALTEVYDTMLGAWSKAKFTTDLQEPLQAAAAAWQTWTGTEQTLTEAYGAFEDLGDGKWRAKRMALVDAQDAALEAAAVFDRAARDLAELQDAQWADMRSTMGETAAEDHYLFVSDIAAELGVDTDGWVRDSAYAYTSSYHDAPLTGRAKTTVAEQNTRLDRAAADISEAGDGVLELVDRIRTDRDQMQATYRAQIDRMLEAMDALTGDACERALERDQAERERDQALADLADDTTLHAECAWAPDLEAAKASITTTTTERDEARDDLDRAQKDVQRLRTQRTAIIAIAAAIIIVLALVALAR